MTDVRHIERLIAIEDIKAMRARFARLLDTKDWAEFAELWTQDATLEADVGEGRVEVHSGRPAIVAFIRGMLDTAITVHQPFGPEIAIQGADRATGVWGMEDRLEWPEGSEIRSLHGFGHYHEEYRRTEGSWRVHSFRLTRLRVEVR